MIKFLKKFTDCCGYAELYKDDILILKGDRYHNHINEIIEGYLLAYKGLSIEFDYKTKEFDKCPYDCD